MSSVKYSDIFTGAQPTFEVTRAQKKANRSSLLSSSRSGDSQKTSSLNGKGTSNKVTPKRGTNENSKSGAKSPKLDAEALAKEFIKSVVFVIWICSYLSSRCFSFHCLKFWFWFFLCIVEICFLFPVYLKIRLSYRNDADLVFIVNRFHRSHRIREERESLRQIADRRKQLKNDEKLIAKEKKKEEKRQLAEYAKVRHADFRLFIPFF